MTIENANRLAEMRRAHGLSQEELAEKLNISRQAVSKWERAESSPDTDNLIALAQLYSVSLDVLLGLQLPEPSCAQEAAEYEAVGEESAEETEASEEANVCEESEMPVDDDPLPHGSYYEHVQQKAAREKERRRMHFPYPLVVVLAYLMLGFCFHLWHPGWIIFLTIPLFYLPDHERRPLRLLGNPVMVTIIYLLLGLQCGWWHPGWLVFFLIPLLNAAQR